MEELENTPKKEQKSSRGSSFSLTEQSALNELRRKQLRKGLTPEENKTREWLQEKEDKNRRDLLDRPLNQAEFDILRGKKF